MHEASLQNWMRDNRRTMTSSLTFTDIPTLFAIKPGNSRAAKLNLFQYSNSLYPSSHCNNYHVQVISSASETILWGYGSVILQITSGGKRNKPQHEPLAAEQKLLNLHASSEVPSSLLFTALSECLRPNWLQMVGSVLSNRLCVNTNSHRWSLRYDDSISDACTWIS